MWIARSGYFLYFWGSDFVDLDQNDFQKQWGIDPFHRLFDPVLHFDPVPQVVFLKLPWLTLASFWILVLVFAWCSFSSPRSQFARLSSPRSQFARPSSPVSVRPSQFVQISVRPNLSSPVSVRQNFGRETRMRWVREGGRDRSGLVGRRGGLSASHTEDAPTRLLLAGQGRRCVV